MEASLSICIKEEKLGVIRFLFAEGVKHVENYMSNAGSTR
jgi:hypothetical protein